MHDSQLLTVDEVAQVMRTSVSTVRQWIRAGRLRAYRPGRRVLVRREDVDAFIDAAAKPCLNELDAHEEGRER